MRLYVDKAIVVLAMGSQKYPYSAVILAEPSKK